MKILVGIVLVVVVVIGGAVMYVLQPSDFGDLLERHTLTSVETVAPAELRVSWLGNTNVLVSDGVNHILTDGWFSRPSLSELAKPVSTDMAVVKASLAKAGITKLDAVIPVHSHYDHLMDAPAVVDLTGAVMMGSASSANAARGWGLDESRIISVDARGSQQFGDFRVTMLRSKHYVFVHSEGNADVGQEITEPLVQPVNVLDYHEGGAYAVLIEHPQGNVLINGSAGYIKGLLAGVHADLVFLGVAGVARQSPEYQQQYWQEVVATTGARTVVPIHWDALTRPLGDEPQAPIRLLDRIMLKVDMKESLMWLMGKGEVFTPILPMWRAIPLRQLVPPRETENVVNSVSN